MKHERITEHRDRPLTMSMWAGDSNSLKIYNRLAELEDKIERGELVDRNEYLDRLMAAKDISGMTDKEIEFFAKHNARVRENADAEIARLTAEVRKQAVREFSERVKMAFYYEFDELIPSIMADKIDEIAKEVCEE